MPFSVELQLFSEYFHAFSGVLMAFSLSVPAVAGAPGLVLQPRGAGLLRHELRMRRAVPALGDAHLGASGRPVGPHAPRRFRSK